MTEARGRGATTRRVPPKLALAVGMPSAPAPKGWQWAPLQSLARLESGHTPSRRHPEYWGGDIPWISIQDAKTNHGRRIHETIEHKNDLGIANSSARVLPENTVCLSRTASVGYVVVMGRPMATSQDFVNWVCSKQLDPDYLKYLLIAEGQDLLRFASGAVHQTIYYPELKAFYVCYPPLKEQRQLVEFLDRTLEAIATATGQATKNLESSRDLFESHLQSTFDRLRNQCARKPLGDLCTFQRGLAYSKEDEVARSNNIVLRAINIDLASHLLDLTELRCISESIVVPSSKRVRKGSLLICTASGSKKHLGKVACIDADYGYAFGAFMGLITPMKGLVARYLFHLMTSPAYKQFISALSYGANINNLKFDDLRAFHVPLPTIAEQQRIADNLDEAKTSTQRLEAICQHRLSALGELRRSIFHRAFTGQLWEPR